MTEDVILTVGTQAIKTIIFLAGPLLIAAMVTGILVSVFQAITQINEATLTFIPKMIGVIIVLVISAPWMLKTIREYAEMIYSGLSEWIR